MNEKLNRVLEFLVSEKTKINTTPEYIKRYLFNDSIGLDEARSIIRKLLESGYVRVVGGKYPVYSAETELFLEDGGFGNEYSTDNVKLSDTELEDQKIKPAEVFISYAWGNPDHEKEVLEFTNFLRKKGFHAEVDKMISQRETTTNFKKMMQKAMQYKKVVVVLSEIYKIKADSFQGGVGTEYQLLINDIEDFPNKYILVTFDGFSESIIPFGLKGNEVVDLSKTDGEEKLLRKLSDQEKFVFAPVAPEKPNFSIENIGEFNPIKGSSIISIEPPAVKVDGSSSQGGLYSSIDYKLRFTFKNVSGKTQEGFAYEAKIVGDKSFHAYDSVLIDEAISQKLFPNKSFLGTEVDFKLRSSSKHQLLDSKIVITVYTDFGETFQEFKLDEVLKISPALQTWGEPQKLTIDMFQ